MYTVKGFNSLIVKVGSRPAVYHDFYWHNTPYKLNVSNNVFSVLILRLTNS